ncbi:ATP-binding protein [Asanoa sp. NPDC049518]|uniref:ATP-binding protein n=1 Tax=unclassified Asanoa TaxID=2685164 RepID=UPI003437D76E
MTHDRRRADYALLLAVGFDAATLVTVRHIVMTMAGRYHLTRDELDDFVVAVNEIMTNAVRHGGGGGELRLWHGGDLLCEVSDHGQGFDPASYLDGGPAPRPSPSGGMGLWLAQQTSDELTIESGPAGTRIGVHRVLVPTDPPISEERPAPPGFAG